MSSKFRILYEILFLKCIFIKKKSEDLARARARARTGPPPGGRGPNAPLERVDRVSSGEFRCVVEIFSGPPFVRLTATHLTPIFKSIRADSVFLYFSIFTIGFLTEKRRKWFLR